MSCPQIYLGTGRSTAPLADDFSNDSITPPTYYVQTGVPLSVQVVVYNHGTDAAPATDLELYWTTPGTFVAPVNLIATYPFANGAIYGAITAGADGTALPVNFGWTPSTTGHFALFARLKNTANPSGPCLAQSYGAYAAPDDPLSAIYNVEVISAGSAGGGMGGTDGNGGAHSAGAAGESSSAAGAAGESSSAAGAAGESSSATGESSSAAGAAGEGNSAAGGTDMGDGEAGANTGSSNGGAAQVSGSAGASGATGSAGAGSAIVPKDDAGCGCSMARGAQFTPNVLFVGLGLFALFSRRHRTSILKWPLNGARRRAHTRSATPKAGTTHAGMRDHQSN